MPKKSIKGTPAPPLPPWQRLHKPVAPAKTAEEEAAEKAAAAAAVTNPPLSSAEETSVGVPTEHPSNAPPPIYEPSGEINDNDVPPLPPLEAVAGNDSDSDDEPTFKGTAVKCPRQSGPAEAYAQRIKGDDDIDALATAVAGSSESIMYDVGVATAKKKPSASKKKSKAKAPPKKKNASAKKKTTTSKKTAAAKKGAVKEGATGSQPQRSSPRQRTQAVTFTIITDAPASSFLHGEYTTEEQVSSPAKKSAKESKKRKAAESAASSKAKKAAKKDPPPPQDGTEAYLPPISPRAQHVTAKMEAIWTERITMLQDHKTKYGTADLTVAPKGEVNQVLKSFVYEQRKQYKKYMSGDSSTLTAERVKVLSDLGFQFDPVGSGTYKANNARRFQVQWDEMYAKLVEYKRVKGHTLVPLGAKVKGETKKLGNWVRGQRKLMNKVGREKFDAYRLAKLDEIGFEWNPMASGAYSAKKKADHFPRVNETWMSWYAQLKNFKEKHGHLIVGPKTKECPGLYNWIHGQRKEYVKFCKKEPNVNMYEEWIKLLNDLGFDWAPMSKGGSFNDMLKKRTSEKFDNKWDSHYKDLCKFRKETGHCYVFRNGENATLAGWVHTQRKQKKLLDTGKHSSLNPQRIELLDKIGFDWRPSESGGIEKLRSPERNLSWDQLFEELKEYKEATGDCSPKKKVPKIGNWVSSQRRLWARNQKGEATALTEERIAKLQSIGFDFSSPNDESETAEEVAEIVAEEVTLDLEVGARAEC